MGAAVLEEKKRRAGYGNDRWRHLRMVFCLHGERRTAGIGLSLSRTLLVYPKRMAVGVKPRRLFIGDVRRWTEGELPAARQ